MRHLSVPSVDTQRVLQVLEETGALPEGARVIADPTDDSRRLIPIHEGHASDYPSVDIEVEGPAPRTYRDQLPVEIRGAVEWPTGHEILGDLILIKLDAEQRLHGTAIGNALITQHPRVRAVYEDRGVVGEFRIRDLSLLSVRDGAVAGTRTQVRESGQMLWTDPAEAYYSARLSREREGTLVSAKALREQIGRPIDVCDPYAGVGPSLKPLIRESGLVGHLFAGDLNPAAVRLLKDNIDHPDTTFECVDALSLGGREEMISAFDLLLVNIPHDTLSHLPSLTPLVRSGGLIRGWAVVDESDHEAAVSTLDDLLGETRLEIRRSYSSTSNLCRFESTM
jgi:tRNA (guanine37-N1)-methyltransferase